MRVDRRSRRRKSQTKGYLLSAAALLLLVGVFAAGALSFAGKAGQKGEESLRRAVTRACLLYTSKRYIEECKKDMASMNVKPATVHPLATEEICGMLDMIGTLIEKGHAYAAADGTVYFRTGSFKEYGKLSHKNLEDLQSGFREIKVTGEEGKEDPADFVLWKPKKDGEPFWESPWCQEMCIRDRASITQN